MPQSILIFCPLRWYLWYVALKRRKNEIINHSLKKELESASNNLFAYNFYATHLYALFHFYSAIAGITNRSRQTKILLQVKSNLSILRLKENWSEKSSQHAKSQTSVLARKKLVCTIFLARAVVRSGAFDFYLYLFSLSTLFFLRWRALCLIFSVVVRSSHFFLARLVCTAKTGDASSTSLPGEGGRMWYHPPSVASISPWLVIYRLFVGGPRSATVRPEFMIFESAEIVVCLEKSLPWRNR